GVGTDFAVALDLFDGAIVQPLGELDVGEISGKLAIGHLSFGNQFFRRLEKRDQLFDRQRLAHRGEANREKSSQQTGTHIWYFLRDGEGGDRGRPSTEHTDARTVLSLHGRPVRDQATETTLLSSVRWSACPPFPPEALDAAAIGDPAPLGKRGEGSDMHFPIPRFIGVGRYPSAVGRTLRENPRENPTGEP